MKLEYNLSIKQTQKLAMTPKMIQEIQLLQYNVQELDLYIQDQMLSNPVLEAVDSRSSEHKTEDGELSSEDAFRYIGNGIQGDGNYISKGKDSEEGRERLEHYKIQEPTLQDHLKLQLMIAAKTKEIKNIGEYIIETLDENGYMTSTIEEISKILSVSRERVEQVINIVRTFDPAGVCAIDLKDCLMLQLERMGEVDPYVEKVIKYHLEDIGENRIQSIAKTLGLSTHEVEEIRVLIKTLDPKPGSYFADHEDVKYIAPDVVITKGKEGFHKEFKDDRVPTLMISSYYKNLLNEAKSDKELEGYLTDKINSAIWLVKCIEKRQQTIKNVVDAILEFQNDFFQLGEMHLKSLTLKTVAEHIGMHESTVSRTVSGKYLQFDNGIYELKYFFTSGIGSQTGESVSSTSVKCSIKAMIDEEDLKKPLSDQIIADRLKNEGYDISRRTVAKYRESLNIPSSSKRRRF